MNKKGSILIAVIWMISIFLVIVSSLASHAGQEVLMTKREMRGLKSRLDFVSALSQAVQMIQQDPLPHYDSKKKEWLGEWNKETLKEFLSVHMEDEESKINLNHASAALLSSFLKEFESEFGPLKGERKDYLQAILKLRFEKRIESLEELLLLEDFKKEDLTRLRPYFTVYSENAFINPNTASPQVLKALTLSLSADNASRQMLLGRLEEACPEGCYFQSEDLNPERFMERLKLPRTPFMTQAVQELLAALSPDSETFQIHIKRTDGAEAAGIFHCRVGQIRPEVYWWHENV